MPRDFQFHAITSSLLFLLLPLRAPAQFDAWPEAPSICVPDLERIVEERTPPGKQPRTIDPVTVVPEPLRKKLTVTYEEWPLDLILPDFGEKLGVPVLIDKLAFTDVGQSMETPASVQLRDEPAYLGLERLTHEVPGIQWYMQDEILRLTTAEVASEVMSSRTYDVADVLNAGFDRDGLISTIKSCTDTHWDDGIAAELEFLDSIIAFRWTTKGHEELACLLEALRRHGEQTFVFNPAENNRVRDQLTHVVSVSIDAAPLTDFADQLAALAGLDIRVDEHSIKDVGVPLSEPISVDLKDRALSTVLACAIDKLGLTAIPDHGLLLITTQEIAEEIHTTAVYDIGDLSKSQCETQDLIEVVEAQVFSGWAERRIQSPRSDLLVIRGSEREHAEVLEFLRGYRKSLAERPHVPENYNQIETRYYTVSAQVAHDLLVTIPELIEPGTWKRVTDPSGSRIETINQDGVGSLLRVAADPLSRELDSSVFQNNCPDDDASQTNEDAPQASNRTLVIPQATLIIRHTKWTQFKIAQLIERLSHHNFGENDQGETLGRMNGGGGGFFSIAPEERCAEPTLSP